MRRPYRRKLMVIIAFSVLTSSFVIHLLSFDVHPVFSNLTVNELRFAVISDIHFGNSAPTPPYNEEVQMLEVISSYHPDFIVDCGDWIYNDHVKWDDAQDYFVAYTNTTIFNVMGNHDDQAYYQNGRDDLYPVFGAPDWMDEATGGTDCYAYLRDNILFIFLSSGSFSNHQISVRFRRFVEYLVAEKFNTQTFVIFCHDGMNATVGHEVGESPLYKSGYWGSTEAWFEDFLSDYGSRCLGIFMGHIHYFSLEVQQPTFRYGVCHFPIGNRAEQYFGLVNLTASGYTYRGFNYDGSEITAIRRDNSTFKSSYDHTAADELLIPIWVQDGSPHGQIRTFHLAQNRKLDLVGVRGNETYINPDYWLENFEGDYRVFNPSLRCWQGRTDYGDYWKSKDEYGGNWVNVTHVVNASSVPSDGFSCLRSWLLRYASGNYYNISVMIRADENADFSVAELNGQRLLNRTATTSWQWFYSNSKSQCIDGIPEIKQIELRVYANTTYYVNFLGWRLEGVTDSDKTDNPSVTINGNVYNFVGTLQPNQNYTYDSFPFPSTNYDDITATSISGNKEVMLVFRYINPTWRVTNAAVSKSGTNIDTGTVTSDYNDTRIIAYMESSPTNPQFMVMRGAITGFTEPSWKSNILKSSVDGTGNAIFIVDCATEGNATSVTVNGIGIDFTYDSSDELISFNVTLGSTQEIRVNFAGAGDFTSPTYTLPSPSCNTTIAGDPCEFRCQWEDETELSYYIFSWNGTGSWSNNSAVAFTGNPQWANETKTLPSAGTVVGYMWYATDTSNNWNQTTVETLTTISPPPSANSVMLDTPNDAATTKVNSVNFTYTPFFSDTIQNASLWLNVSATWQRVAWNSSAVLNATQNGIQWNLAINGSGTYIWNIEVWNSTAEVFAVSNRTLYVEIEPYWNVAGHNNTEASCPVTFYCEWQDGDGLSGYVFGTNVTGSWTNDTWSFLGTNPAWANESRTLPASAGVRVEYQWWCNDTTGQWNTTGLEFLVTTDTTAPTYNLPSPSYNTTITGNPCMFSCQWQDNTALSHYIFSWNGTGGWRNDTAVAFSTNRQWANVTKTLPAAGAFIVYIWYANDTNNNWNETLLQSFTVLDVTPPTIGSPSQNPDPDAVEPYQNVTVTVEVVDEGVGVREVILSYSTDGGQTWTNTTMDNIVEDTYAGEIPGFEADTHVQYKIIAYDNANNSAVEDNAGSYYVYTVIPEFQRLLLLIFIITTLTAFILTKARKHADHIFFLKNTHYTQSVKKVLDENAEKTKVGNAV